MTLFFISAALLVVVCLVFLLAGLFRANTQSIDQETVNITLARERRTTLDAALANGSIDQSTHDYERAQLEHDLAADLQPDDKKHADKKGHVAAAVVVAVFIPIAAGTLYLHLGNPTAITHDRNTRLNSAGSAQAGASPQTGTQAPALAELLPKLEERLAETPDDIEGWRLLGRTYLSVNDFTQAQTAFAKAVALDADDVPTLAQLAESIAMISDGDLAGEPTALLERANVLDPTNEHTLWLLAIARQQAGNHQEALAGFDQLADIVAGNPEALATIEQMRSRSVRPIALGDGSVDSTTPPSSSNVKREESANEITTDTSASGSVGENGTSVTVHVDLTPEALAAADAGAAVFVYAKATSGPPMPLAVSRHTVNDLPLSISLDDSMAMIPTMKLSSFPSVTVGARISASGNPIGQSGDWFAEVGNITLADTGKISLTISQQVP